MARSSREVKPLTEIHPLTGCDIEGRLGALTYMWVWLTIPRARRCLWWPGPASNSGIGPMVRDQGDYIRTKWQEVDLTALSCSPTTNTDLLCQPTYQGRAQLWNFEKYGGSGGLPGHFKNLQLNEGGGGGQNPSAPAPLCTPLHTL